jgi:cobalamin biosynthetic protein CobC
MTNRIVHGGGITAAARLYGGRPEDWLDLSTGINPNPVALPEIPVSAWHRLPDQHLVERAREAARIYYRSGDILPLPVPGTQSVIQLLPRLGSVSGAAILSPTYGEYARAFALANLPALKIAEIGDLSLGRNLVIAVNPNKFFGLAGLRLGFAIAEASISERFEDWLGPWAVSGPALSLAASLMAGDTTTIRNRILDRRAALDIVLSGAKLKTVGGTGLFALVADDHASDIYSHLCRHHILVRKFDYAPNWLRIGLAPDEEADRRLAGALEDYSI